jgi:hypothetical protein
MTELTQLNNNDLLTYKSIGEGHSFLEHGEAGDKSPVYVHRLSKTNFLGYVEWLKKRDIIKSYKIEECGKKWLKYWCPKGHYVFKQKLCRERHFCPNDAEIYTWERVEHAYETIKEFALKMPFKVYLIHLVFTLPKELWIKAVENPDLFIKTIYDTFNYYDGLKGGVLALHLNHSKNAKNGWYPHIHVILLNVCVYHINEILKEKKIKKKIYGNVIFKRKRPYFKEKLLKLRYKWSIEKNFNYKFNGLPDVFMHYIEFKKENERIIKRRYLRYAFRLPILDFKDVDFNKLTEEESNFIWQLLNTKIKRIRWFGYLSDGVKTFYLSVVGVNYITLTELRKIQKRKMKYCPIHNLKLTYVGIEEIDDETIFFEGYYELKGAG